MSMPGVLFKVRAVYEYSSQHEDDLTFEDGQIISVTEDEDADWYFGEYMTQSGEKKSGLFPKNFVEKYEPAPPPRPVRALRAVRPCMEHQASLGKDSVSQEQGDLKPLQSTTASTNCITSQSPVCIPEEADQATLLSPSLEPCATEDSEIIDRSSGNSTSDRSTCTAATRSMTRELQETTVSQDDTVNDVNSKNDFTTTEAPSEPGEPTKCVTSLSNTSLLPSSTGSPPKPTNTAAALAQRQPPPVAAKSSSFRERIAAFNKSTAPPVIPFTTTSLSNNSSGFIKKPFVAPPPLRDSYVPTVRDVSATKIHKRDEGDVKSSDANDTRSGEQITLVDTMNVSNQQTEESDVKPTSLKERIALLHKQQMEQEARRSDLVSKEKSHRLLDSNVPVETISNDSGNTTQNEFALPSRVFSMPLRPLDHVNQEITSSESVETVRKISANSSLVESVNSTLSLRDRRTVSDEVIPENFSRDDQPSDNVRTPEEEAAYAEAKRQMDLRDRMAKLSRGMGMPGMFALPGVAPSVSTSPGTSGVGKPGSAASSGLGPTVVSGAVPTTSSTASYNTSQCNASFDQKVENSAPSSSPVRPTSQPKAPTIPSLGINVPKTSPSVPQDTHSPDTESVKLSTDDTSPCQDDSIHPVISPVSSPSSHDAPMSNRSTLSPSPTIRELPPSILPTNIRTNSSLTSSAHASSSTVSSSEYHPSSDAIAAARTSFAAAEHFIDESVHRNPPPTVAPTTSLPVSTGNPSEPPFMPPPIPPGLPIQPPKHGDGPGSRGSGIISSFNPSKTTSARSSMERSGYISPNQSTLPTLKLSDSSLDLSSESGEKLHIKAGSQHPSTTSSKTSPSTIFNENIHQGIAENISHSHTNNYKLNVGKQTSRGLHDPSSLLHVSQTTGNVTNFHEPASKFQQHTAGSPGTLIDHSNGSSMLSEIPAGNDNVISTSSTAHMRIHSDDEVCSSGLLSSEINTNQSLPPPPPPHAAPSLVGNSVHSMVPSSIGKLTSRQSYDTERSSTLPTLVGLSGEINRVSHDQSFIANDIDMEPSTVWWAQPNGIPPCLHSRHDVLVQLNQPTTTYLGGQNIITKSLYILYVDYSQTSITARYDVANPVDCQLEQRHEPPPPPPRQDMLETAHAAFGAKLMRLAETRVNTVVGDGTPLAFVQDLLKDLTDALIPVGTRAYGAVVYSNIANASVSLTDEIRPGDIISFRNCKFQGKHGPMHVKYNMEVGKPDHVGVVVEWDGTRKKIKVWVQGREKVKIRAESFRLSDLRSGEVKVWRVMPKTWIGWA